MVNTEQGNLAGHGIGYYNILNIVVNTELSPYCRLRLCDYNILNIVVNTEQGSCSK